MIIGGKEVRLSGQILRVGRLHGDKYEFPDNPAAFLADLRNTGTRVDLFTFLQRLPDTTPRYPYPFEWDNLAVLQVSTFEDWWSKQIRSYARNRARQAEKRGVVLREIAFDDSLLQGICEIYNECPIRQGRRFPHYGITLVKARAYAGTFLSRSIFIGAFLGERMIGFAKMVTDETQTQACLVHILSLIQHRDKAPTNALVAQAIRTCADRKISYLVYENFAYGKKVDDGLRRFKEINGFQRIDVPRYYVPMTLVGELGFRLGLHHRLVDRLPESIISKLRDLRRVLYSRRFQTVAEV